MLPSSCAGFTGIPGGGKNMFLFSSALHSPCLWGHCDGAQSVKQEHLQRLQYLAGRLVYALHALCYKKLGLTPKPKKKRLKRT